ncbi:putative T7SS-secreted protein [Saccharopolyspora sp. NPDC002376]
MAWTNSSSWSEDWDAAGKELTRLGQAVGLVEQDLIPGEPEVSLEWADHLSKIGDACEQCATGFAKIDAGGWTGQAADAAREQLQQVAPAAYRNAADAFHAAADALRTFAGVLADAQRRAAEAQKAIEAADVTTEQAQIQHQRSGNPMPFRDPSAAQRAAAQNTIATAKAEVARADAEASRIVMEATGRAPEAPSFGRQMWENAKDGFQTAGSALWSFGAGVVDAGVGLGTMAWQAVKITSPGFAITHPEEAQQFNATIAAGVQGFQSDPLGSLWKTTKTVVDVDGLRQDPMRWAGSQVDSVAVATKVAKLGKLSKLGKLADEVPNAPTPHPPSVQPQHAPQPGGPTPPAHNPVPSRPDALAPSTPNGYSAPQHLPGGPGVAPHYGGPAPHPAPLGMDAPHGPGNPPSAPHPEPSAGHHPPEPPTPERRIQDALDNVRATGSDGLGRGHNPYDFTPGTDHLPEGLSRSNPDPWGLDSAIQRGGVDDPNFVYRNVDPADEANALWRAAHSSDIDELFRTGELPRSSEGHADFEALDGHVGGNTHSRFVSTSDSLEHVLHRAQMDPDTYGDILKIRSGGGIDVDATMHNLVGDSPLGYVGHGEREVGMADGINPANIEGVFRPVEFDPAGRPSRYTWIPNPNFNPAVLRGTSHS